ncbi:MAG: phosphopantothenate--cysteine ligase [Enterococcus lacertideformus]|uniref:Phosphopantothenate--cysteine ligase n=1 Tax=Enterococcus lacertideformus TaxID=2771493 RepID=A0A931AZE5_9ENTE|nr:phosphopantothenate--cysteine ligase [Enterococcus lacertideformus]
MNILITAGGTSEKIDQVRSITNHSTGRLGKNIAEVLLQHPSVTIDYVTTPVAIKPNSSEKIHFHFIESTQDLFETLKELCTSKTYDGIIHSMAVSDFTPSFSLTEEQLVKSIAQTPLTPRFLSQWLQENEVDPIKDEKISSDTQHLFITLKKTPKIISYLRKWQPKAKIIGFKLLVDVSKIHLLEVAQKSLKKNQVDYIFANDLSQIEGQNHHGFLLAADGIIKEAQTKKEIANLLTSVIIEPSFE